jgi:hypothetical protein
MPNFRPDEFHGWLKLPTELKLEVLSCYLTFDGKIDMFRHLKIMNKEINAIIKTSNHDLVTLALETYYKLNSFCASARYRWGGRYSMDHPPMAYASLVRRLHVELAGCNLYPAGDKTILKGSGWHYLGNPAELPHASANSESIWDVCRLTSSNWQSIFSSLTRLHLILDISVFRRFMEGKSCSLCKLDINLVQELLAWVEKTICIKASEVSVMVTIYSKPVPVARRCDHIVTLEEELGKMIKRI